MYLNSTPERQKQSTQEERRHNQSINRSIDRSEEHNKISMSPPHLLPITTPPPPPAKEPESALQRWMKRFHEADALVAVVVDMIAERDSVPPSLPREAQRRTAEIRRTVAIIGTRLELLQEDLSALPNKQHLRSKELRKVVKRFEDLSSRVKSVAAPFTRKRFSSSSSDRNDLLGPDENCTVIDINSAATASMDNSQIVQLQRDVMKEQDADLYRLEKSIASTKHIALTINKELDLHTKLIDDLDEHTEETSYQLHRVQKQLRKSLSRRIQEGGSCVYTLLSVIVIIVFVTLTQH